MYGGLKVIDDLLIRLRHEEEMLQAMKRRLLRCCNLTSLDLSWDLTCLESHNVEIMSELLKIAPRLVKISTYTMENWIVYTTLGAKLYNQYKMDEALTSNNVLQIVWRCLVSYDAETLQLFCAIIPSDFLLTYSFTCICSFSLVDSKKARACFHYIYGVSRKVELCQNNNNIWIVMCLSESLQYEGLKFMYCNT